MAAKTSIGNYLPKTADFGSAFYFRCKAEPFAREIVKEIEIGRCYRLFYG